MPQWEYKDFDSVEEMNKAGQEGWEAYAIISPSAVFPSVMFCAKRIINNIKE